MLRLPSARSSYTLSTIIGFLVASLLICSSSCGSSQQQGPVKHFSLTLALSESVGDAGSALPEDIKAMFMPLEAKNCPGILFIPDVKIIRLDIQEAKPEELDLGQDQNAVQKAAGQAPKAEKARSVRENALKIQQITSLMAQPSGPNSVTIDNIKKLLLANQPVLTTEGTQQSMGGILSANNITVARSPNELITKLTTTFCSKPGAKPQLTSCIIIYKPGTLVSETASISPTSIPSAGGETKNPTPSPPTDLPQPPQSHDDADKLYDQLSLDVRQAIAGQINKKAVHAKLAKAQAEMTWDYRFTYERAKLAVYGTQKHDEAFYHLYRAAEIAIENGEADKMLKAVENDSSEEGPLHKLKHGHDKHEEEYQMSTILEALRTKNASLVRKLS